MAQNRKPISLFGYASLAGADGARPAMLAGYRRVWDVAMDNSLDLPTYKHYLDPGTGKRPQVFVAFLNLRADSECTVNGALLEVDGARLEALDLRERNYKRVELPSMQVYSGTDEARRRFAIGAQAGNVVIAAEYHEAVTESFRRLGEQELATFEASTDPPPCPIVDLRRIDPMGSESEIVG